MIYYIYHSGFIIELEKNILIFDFYKFSKEIEKKYFFENFLKNKNKRIFIFASHNHADHFNREILEWEKVNEKITYILSEDIVLEENKENYIFTSEGDEINIIKNKEGELGELDMKIQTFGSTDLGVSFYVNIENINIFHAGDLHFWHWEDDTENEERDMKKRYLEILDDIKQEEQIDIAFTPIDPRLRANTYEGVELFSEILKPKVIIPMHFGDDYSRIEGFIEKFRDSKIKAIEIKKSMEKIMEL